MNTDQPALFQKNRAERLSAALKRLHKAVRKLGATTKDDATLTAWQELNGAQAQAIVALSAENEESLR